MTKKIVWDIILIGLRDFPLAYTASFCPSGYTLDLKKQLSQTPFSYLKINLKYDADHLKKIAT